MQNIDEIIATLEEQERTLHFSEFTSETALQIGMSIVERAKAEKMRITIDITRNGHQLFHYAFDGTTPDNDQWVLRKNRTVNRFNRSSLLDGMRLQKAGRTIEERSKLSSSEYASNGGAFPIIIKNVGVIGTITVSGLAHEEDHALVVWAIKKYLGL